MIERLLLLCALAAAPCLSWADTGFEPGRALQALPLRFEAAAEAQAEGVLYQARGDGYALFLAQTEAVLVLRDNNSQDRAPVLRMRLAGSSGPQAVLAEDPLSGTSSYFVGDDHSSWRSNVRGYARVLYQGVYPGIDLVYYGKQRRLEYDFLVAAGISPALIKMEWEGADIDGIEANGALALSADGGRLFLEAPVAYQTSADGSHHAVQCSYQIAGNRIGFSVGSYDTTRPLIIDPVLSYASYLGGSNAEQGHGIAVDAAGKMYIVGTTISDTFPTTNSCAECENNTTVPSANDAFIAKIDPSVSGAASLVYATYLGGNDNDSGMAIAVDDSGQVYVTGSVESTNFPTTPNALQGSLKGGNEDFNAFVAKLDSSGSQLLYSTYLGGARTEGKGIAVTVDGLAVVVGGTTSDEKDFPTNGGFQSAAAGGPLVPEAFITVVNATGTGAIASSYLGGSLSDVALAVVLDGSASAYMVGNAVSQDFPTTPGVLAPSKNPNNTFTNNGFIARVDIDVAAGALSLAWASYISGGEIVGRGVAVDAAGNVHVGGSINFASGFVLLNPVQATPQGGQDGFVMKLSPTGSTLLYSTYLGGSGSDSVNAIAVDSNASAHVVGTTTSVDFPLERPWQASHAGGGNDAFVSKISSAGGTLLYSTYVGGVSDDQGRGVAVGGEGNTYMVGFSSSSDFPTVGAKQAVQAGSIDVIVAKLFDSIGLACTQNSECDDGEACNGTETCSANVCVVGSPPDCDDGNVCTDDSCVLGFGCSSQANTAACGDGNACNGEELCSAGSCQSGTALNCDDGNLCTNDSCAPASGCVNADNTAACDDGNACTSADSCTAGVCVGGAAPNCDDGNICTNDSCAPASGCVNADNTVPCDDSNACTTADSCTAGVCVGGAAPNCDDGNICTNDSCAPASGCVNADNTAACDDGNACTSTDSCAGGVCVGSAPLDCDDGNICTTDSCDPAGGCSNASNVVSCDDGQACTTGDICSLGQCAGSPIDCSGLDGQCSAGTCNPATAACEPLAVNEGLACDDGDACTQIDICASGSCVGGAPVVCTSSDQCHDGGICNPSSGICSGPAKSDGTACNDDNACTTSDVCSAGVCLGGAPPNCADANPCTDDICIAPTGCANVGNISSCDDGNACTTADTCAGGVCVGGAAPDCDDGNICTDDSCNPATGCINFDNSTVCDDGDICSVTDACDGGVCVAVDARSIDDAKIKMTLKAGADNDRLSVNAVMNAAEITVLPSVGGFEVILVTTDAIPLPVYVARVEAVDFVDFRGKGTRFKFRDKTKSRPDGLLRVTVKIMTGKGLAKVKVRARGQEMPAASGQPSISLSLVYGDALSGDCLSAVNVGCVASSSVLRCRLL